MRKLSLNAGISGRTFTINKLSGQLRLAKCLHTGSLLVLLVLGTLTTQSLQANELTALEIMQRVDDRNAGNSSIGTSSMILIDRQNRQRTRQLKQYAKKYDSGTKYMAYFLAPADLKDTVYINHDWDGIEQDDDSWLYLPALQKVKRISSEDRSGPFLGSDFSYADISGFELQWNDYRIVDDSDPVDGQDCWVIEYSAKPEFQAKALRSTGTLKTRTWVRKDNFLQVKSQLWSNRSGRVKYYSASDIELLNGIWTPRKMQMVTTRQGKKEHATLLILHTIEYNVEVPDRLFSSENMQRFFAGL